MADLDALTLAAELDWLESRLDARIAHYLGDGEGEPRVDPESIEPPPLPLAGSRYAEFVTKQALGTADRLLLALCLAPALRPQALDILLTQNSGTGRGFTEFGGHTVSGHGGFLPSGETAIFLLCGADIEQRIRWTAAFAGGHPLVEAGVLRLETAAPGGPALSGALRVRADLIDLWTTGRSTPPRFGPGFPAQQITTHERWDDLVLPANVLSQLSEIRAWLAHGETLLDDWGFGRRMKPGFRSLFHGPPGTGKTMTAALLGQVSSRAVYRVDLSMVVSKYIGETEKNLARVFDVAEGRDWILFFDEADALFGKRTQVKDARDRFANQQIAYLLQRIEVFPGVVLLASNLRDHIDPAFARRFHSVIYFPMPDRAQRQRLWQNVLGPPVAVDPSLDLSPFIEYELSGAAIVNAVRGAALATLAAGANHIDHRRLYASVRRELQKEGRSA